MMRRLLSPQSSRDSTRSWACRPAPTASRCLWPGFKSVQRAGIELTTNFTAPVNAQLEVGSVEETLTVSGAAPVVDVQNAANRNII